MKMILSLRDRKAELFMQPFFVVSLGVAYRNLLDELQRGGDDNVLAKHPGDFQLYDIGVFDDDTGEVTGHSHPRLLCEVEQLLVQREPVVERPKAATVSAAQLDLQDRTGVSR